MSQAALGKRGRDATESDSDYLRQGVLYYSQSL